ncbi:MAG: FG-GAP repeat domain-containing protein, partial [Thermoanaerobaculia bacterium]
MPRFLTFVALSLLALSSSAEICTFDLAAPVSHDAGYNPGDVAIADFNNDSIPDLAVQNRHIAAGITILLGTGTSYTNAGSLTLPTWAQFNLGVGDLNNDNKIDLVLSYVASGVAIPSGVGVFLGNGDGTFGSVLTHAVFQNPNDVVVAHFDNDSFLDIAATKLSGFELLQGNGDGTFESTANVPLLPSSNVQFQIGAIAAGDFNEDGKLDLALTESESPAIHIFQGNGNGTFLRKTPIVLPDTDSAYRALAAGDFDGDGDADLAYSAAGGTADDGLIVHLSNGDFTFGAGTSYGEMTAAEDAATADIDGDGDLDVIVSVQYVVHVYLNNGRG